VLHQGRYWDVQVSRKAPTSMIPVWLVRFDPETRQETKTLFCQVQKSDRFGWTVVVAGDKVSGPRLVEGFKSRWQAIKYAAQLWSEGGS
jgi:hypothetical protein